jgi:lipid-binding SYLF domain-containing protein
MATFRPSSFVAPVLQLHLKEMEPVMRKPIFRFLAVAALLLSLTCKPSGVHAGVSGTLWSASEVLEGIKALPLKCIPSALMSKAQGVAIIPKVLRVGLGLGGRFGEGVVLVRNPDGTWGDPIFVSFAGGSVGWQVGVESVDLVLVFKTRKSLDRILQGKGKLTLGADVSVAAGPVGRQAEADTDARLQAEICSYSRSKGLFAGIALEGSAITNDGDANRAFTQHTRQEDLMAAAKLKAQLGVMSGNPILIAPPPRPILVPGPPPAALLPPPGPGR